MAVIHPQDDAVATGFGRLAEQRCAAELELVGAVWAAPSRLVRVAAAAGIRRLHFIADDLALIYAAFVAGVKEHRRAVLLRAMRSLMSAGYWDHEEIAANLGRARWSASTLVALENRWFPSVTVVQYFAGRVVELAARQIHAEVAYKDCLTTLDGDGSDS